MQSGGLHSAEGDRFAAVVESALNAVVIVDCRGTIVQLNAQTERLFQYERSELLGQKLEMLVPERLRGGHEERQRDYFATPGSRPMGVGRELLGRRQDGTELPIEISLNPLPSDEGTFVLAAIVDITERKRTEESLLYMAAIVESSTDAIIGKTLEGTVVSWNPGAEVLYGYRADEMIGAHIARIAPPERAEEMEGLLNRLRRGERMQHFETVRVRKDGMYVDVSLNLSPIRDGRDRIVGASSIARDISEQKRAAVRLVHKTEEVEAFVYIVSHDLRTPLVNLQGFGAELQASCKELNGRLSGLDLPPEVRAILDDDIPVALRYIGASTAKFERLINALLSLSRTGRQEYRNELLDVGQIVQTTLDSLQQSVEKSGAVVEVGALPPAYGDATAVGQVFSNLLANAILYLDGTRTGRIEIRGDVMAGMSHYEVKDNGLGIPDAALARVFQVFQRFHPEHAPGDGMGLATVKRVVERHGGKVWVESESGLGSVFHVLLPGSERNHA